MRLLDEWAAARAPKAGSAIGPADCSVLADQIRSAKLRREAGDVAGSRALLERIAKAIPAADDPQLIAAFTRHADELNKDAGDDARTEGNMEMLESLMELSVGVIEERIALGDMSEALALARRTIEATRRSVKGSLKPMIGIALSRYLAQAGAPRRRRTPVRDGGRGVCPAAWR